MCTYYGQKVEHSHTQRHMYTSITHTALVSLLYKSFMNGFHPQPSALLNILYIHLPVKTFKINGNLTVAEFEPCSLMSVSTLSSANPNVANRESVGKLVSCPADPSLNLSNKMIALPKPSLPFSLHLCGDEKDNIQSPHEFLTLHMLHPAHHGETFKPPQIYWSNSPLPRCKSNRRV